MVYRIFLATALIVSNVALYHLSVSLISLIHGARRRSYGFARSTFNCFITSCHVGKGFLDAAELADMAPL